MVNEARYPNGTSDLLRPELANGGLSLSGDTVTIESADLPDVPLEGAVVWMNEWFVSRTAIVTRSGGGSLSATLSDDSDEWDALGFLVLP